MPITATIIVQLLRVVIPHFEALHKEGQSGTAKLTQYTRYLTIALAVLQSSTFVTFAHNPQSLFGASCTNILSDDNWWTPAIMVLTMTAGTGLIMWLGELITDRGVGIPDIAKAMEPMFTTGDAEERAGLGFAVMQSFMDKVKVSSAPGRGTRVTLTKRLDARA